MASEKDLPRISQSFNETENLLREQATRNINLFIEYTCKDSKGNRIVQAEIHKEVQWHIDECKRRKMQNCGVLAPWGHGKTEQAIFRLLDEVGKDPDILTQFICNTDDNAMDRVSTAKQYIEHDQDYHNIYPHIIPSVQQDEWGKHKIVVNRNSKSKDGTVEAYGITTSGTGSRSDLQIFDDPVDMRNAITNPAMRQQIKDIFRNVWMSRLVADGFRIYIATIWHEDDLTSELLVDPEWSFLVIKVSDDFSCFECESPFKGSFKIPLWKVWDEPKLKKQFRTLGERAFNRGFRQQPMSSSDMTFPNSDGIFKWDMSRDIVQPHWPRITGIDPFGQWVVLFTIAINPHNHLRVPVEIRRGAWQPNQTINEIRDVYLKHMPVIMVCENNASQIAIHQWAQSIGGLDLPLLPFVTGQQKANMMIGLPSLDVEFANGAWAVPMMGIDKVDNEDPFMVFRTELRGHPSATNADTVMAAWFAREGARYLLKMEEEGDGDNNEVHDASEVLGVEEQVIGDY